MGTKPVRYEGCGLPNVFLMNGLKPRETPYAATIAVDDVEGLHRAIGNALVDKQDAMTGAEFRFFRRLLDFSQKPCSEQFDVDARAIADWEKDVTLFGVNVALANSST